MKREKGFTLIELLVVTANTTIDEMQFGIDLFIRNNRELPNRKDASTENYYTLLFSGMDSDGTALTTVRMEDKQGVDKSTTGVLDIVDFPLIKRDNLYNHLLVNNRFYPVCKPKKDYGWCESYIKLKGDMLDPWGNSYFVVFRDL